jgi:protein gp37
MGIVTNIQWCHHTFNMWRGCTKVSAGCKFCYAEKLSVRNPAVLGEWGDDGSRVIASESYWRQPISWDKKAREAGERRRVFCASLADVFEDRRELEQPRKRLLGLIPQCRDLDWLLLTKRPQNVMPMLGDGDGHTFHGHTFLQNNPHVWIGASAENQETASMRSRLLLGVPSAIRFLSCEPLLGPLDLGDFLKAPWMPDHIVWPGSVPPSRVPVRGIEWVIVGGESGSQEEARACDLSWVTSIVGQCERARVPCFVKQLGTNPTRNGKRLSLGHDKGGDPSEWPLKMPREFPRACAGRS